jgi:hypothetical protein
MIFNDRSLSEISLDDILILIANRVPEGPNLDFKQTAYSGRPQDIREMLRDVISMANADGGYIILGVEEENGRATNLAPFIDYDTKANAILQASLDGISERIKGLEVRAYNTSGDQGIIVLHVPSSSDRPHMVSRDGHTDFFKRWDTLKRPMGIEEIRWSIFENPQFRQFIELQLEAQRSQEGLKSTQEVGGSPFLEILTSRFVERFLIEFMRTSNKPQVMMILSPYIGDLTGGLYTLKDLIDKVNENHTRVYVITSPPSEEYQAAAMELFQQSQFIEIRFNPQLHAKLYINWCKEENQNFAMFGSGNLTTKGMVQNIELGMLLRPRGFGRKLIRQLYDWSNKLRPQSKLVKPILAQRL